MAVAVGVLLVMAAIGAVMVILQNSLSVRTTQDATAVAEKYADAIQTLADANWNSVYLLPTKTSSSQYYLFPTSTPPYSSSTYLIYPGVTTTQSEGRTFNISFAVENVNRDLCGVGNATSSPTTLCPLGPNTLGIANDPSTQKITVNINWGANSSISKVKYITRNINQVFVQNSWSGGFGQVAFPASSGFTYINNQFTTSTQIDYSSSTGAIIISSNGPGTFYSSGAVTSSIFDTWSASGTALNSIIWQGSALGGSSVQFQIATSNCSNGATNPPACSSGIGAWPFLGPACSPAPADVYAPINNTRVNINNNCAPVDAGYNYKRYFRYEIYLNAGSGNTVTPIVDSVIIGWSP